MARPASPDAAPPAWGRAGWAVVAAAFLVGFAQGPLSAVGYGLTHLPGDRIDGRFNCYVLEHGYRWARGEVPSFWDLPICYPAPRMTAYSDAHLGSLPVYAGLRAVGLSQESAFQSWYLLAAAANYVTAVWAARRVGVGPAAAAVCGTVFAFSAVSVGSVLSAGHVQLGPRFLVPSAVLLGRRWLLDPTARRLAGLAACLVLQAYLTIYIAYFLGLLVLATWGATAVIHRHAIPWRRLVAGWPRWLLVGGVAVVALVPLVQPYLRAAHDHPTAGPPIIRLYTPDTWAWLLAPELSRQAGWMADVFPPPAGHPFLGELRLFPGWLPLLALPAAALLARRRPDTPAVLAVAGLALALAMTRVSGVCLYDLALGLPGANSIRVPARVVLVLVFPAGLGLGYLIEELARGRRPVEVGLLAVTLADQSLVLPGEAGGRVWADHRTPIAGLTDRGRALAELVWRERPDARLLYVFPRPDDTDLLPAGAPRLLDEMWAAQALGIPTVNGYSGYWPFGWPMARDYDALFGWLPPDRRGGLVVVGEPTRDSPGNAAGRAAYPPLRWPDP